MVKNIIFDLSEVIISGFHKTEEIIEKNTNIKAEEFLAKRREVGDIFLDTMRGKHTEDEYIEALIEHTMKDNVKEVILAHCVADEVCSKFVDDVKGKIKVSVTEVGKEYNF